MSFEGQAHSGLPEVSHLVVAKEAPSAKKVVDPLTFLSLPTNLQILVFSFLRPRDWANVCLVCRTWQLNLYSDDLWCKFYTRSFGCVEPEKLNSSGSRNFSWRSEFMAAKAWHNSNYKGKPVIFHSLQKQGRL